MEGSDTQNTGAAPPPPPSTPPAPTGDGQPNGDPTIGSPEFNENKSASGLPAESIEQGAAASTYVPNPDAPEGSIAQIEVLPDESVPSASSDGE